MSRTGKMPIAIPDKVKARVDGDQCFVEGPQGKHQVKIAPGISVDVQDKEISVSRPNNSGDAKRWHGLTRALINSAVKGVSEGFTKTLLIEGVGYRADLKGSSLNLSLGFSHPVVYQVPEGVKAQVDKQTKIVFTSSDSDLVGQVAADVRSFRPPEPYKGKGIRYENEYVQRKVGKAAGGAK